MHYKAQSALSACLALGMILGLGACIAPATPTARPGETLAVSLIDDRVDGYLALAPRVLQSGQEHTVSVSLFHGQGPANAQVELALQKDGQALAHAAGRIRGRGDLVLPVPALAEGDYTLELSGRGFRAQSPVRVEESTLLFLESDKPIYKPGQTVHLRVLTLDSRLRPLAAAATLEVADAKGLKIFKKELQTDEFGMISADLPLSSEPNLGVWKATVRAGKRQAQLDFRVERYVLPKYEVKVNLAKGWALASEPIAGTIGAEYSYGKPVQGEVEIVVTRYVGTWEEYARVTRAIDGQADFSLPAAGYVAGLPGESGAGNVQLEVTVREKATGYEEKTTRLLTVVQAPVVLSAIPESAAFKPGLGLSILFVAETPDKEPTDAEVTVEIGYMKSDLQGSQETRQVSVRGGKGLLKIAPPKDAIALNLNAHTGGAYTTLALQAGYSPTGSFIHVEQASSGRLKVGDSVRFHISATKEAANFYYEVLARGRVIFSDYTRSPDIELTLSPEMAPSARLLVYQILPNNEVAADYVPFDVAGDYPLQVQAAFSQPEVEPGDAVGVSVETEGPARVGLAAVDRSVFILAENRLNLQQVFDELERLYQQPQVELHEAFPMGKIPTCGASETFRDAGVVVLSNRKVPSGKEYELPFERLLGRGGVVPAVVPEMAAPQAMREDAGKQSEAAGPGGGLAEVQRVRQFFPETWLWLDLNTDAAGRASQQVQAPDSITTWMLRAVALSKEKGLGVAEAELRVLQPFFLSIDLPYACIRGEEFPVKVALYNYTDTPQQFTVELERAGWFDLLDEAAKSVTVGANDLGGAEFTIRPNGLGTRQVKVTARSRETADAVVKDLIVEPEGVAREMVENLVLSAGGSREIDTSIPPQAIEGSAHSYLGITGSYLTQAIEGLEGLIRMPSGCGEQNMILFAPNVFVARYLRETNQLKPEVMAKAEAMMITGYQRELVYRRADNSFSAFGNSDQEGSLWLTAFVLKTFAQARDLVFIDDAVLSSAQDWVVGHQNSDGSFDPVGFVHHQEMLGGLKGKTALTAYVAVALKEAGETAAFGRAVRYLEEALPSVEDSYTLAIGTYALELAKSPKAAEAYERLLKAAKEADGALYWGDPQPQPLPEPGQPSPRGEVERPNQSAAVETTGYALLALLEHGDRLSASRAARWLVGQRNAYGGYASTQDTVVGLQALTAFAANAKSDVDATLIMRSSKGQREVRVSPENADVLQLIDLPVGERVTVEARGSGQVVLQAVRRFNLPTPDPKQPIFQIDVSYGAEQVAVNDLLEVATRVRFTPPEPLQAGMTIVDVAVPTGFAPVAETVEAAVQQNAKIKRSEIAGRKVIFYIEDMAPGDELAFTFQARALYPVRAQAVPSQVYAYYRPEFKGESLGGAVTVR